MTTPHLEFSILGRPTGKKWSRRPIDIARAVFPNASDGELNYIIWNHTGFPCFWSTRELPGWTIERIFVRQLGEFRAGIHVEEDALSTPDGRTA
jgi:hypothetical protein